MFLLDSNIIIYTLAENQKITTLIDSLKDPCLLSVISKLEILFGANKDKQNIEYVKNAVDQYAALHVDNGIADKAFQMKHSGNVSLKFKDLIIAATALEHNLTLVTADKEFKKIKGLKLKFVKV